VHNHHDARLGDIDQLQHNYKACHGKSWVDCSNVVHTSEGSSDTVVHEQLGLALHFALCFRCTQIDVICIMLQCICLQVLTCPSEMRHVVLNALIQELDIHRLLLVKSQWHALQLIRAQLEIQV